ncbi:tetratricopeptide repeat protein [Geminocystis sp. NIES-3709]|uniref:O-linked N-acetylglucosamine transferase, SPINDLY family protein n=1 Tax=Geminocystis sp. NIES-3709 TaxID=1617448 RepID=UPI0005FCD379|nr:tetratricopeptide repeat protein [Geminocystis sp. NIES-3709]BAQ65624.1 TPR domain protein [Geminocystis sp. NIES-3709]
MINENISSTPIKALNIWQEALIAHQKSNLPKAIELYRQVILQNPDFADAYANLAMALSYNAQREEADRAFHYSLQLQPNHATNHSNYGFFLSCTGEYEKAVQHLRRAIQINPQLSIAWFNLGNTLRYLDRWEEAVSCYQVALPLDPNHIEILSDWNFAVRKICRWSVEEYLTMTLLQASARQLELGKISPINPFVACFLPLSLQEFQEVCASHAQALSNLVNQTTPDNYFKHVSPHRSSNRKIKIGYVCAGFLNHPTGQLTQGMFERYDRNRFEVYGYAISKSDGSVYRQEIEKSIEHFRLVDNLSNLAIAEMIFEDGIDILIDLDGYTSNHRQGVFAFKPAPIQVTWLAFAGTTGADYIDYLIADEIIVPPQFDRFYTETVIRLPHTYQVNNHRQLPPLKTLNRATERKREGLPEDAIVFCSFNNNAKIDRSTYNAWLQILKAIPNSVLWILVDTSEGLENMHSKAQKAGIAPSRIIRALHKPLPEHLQRLQLGDLFLDSFICNAHTTATDALWGELPVLTCQGKTFASRVGASLLTSSHLPQLICTSPQEFIKKAIELAQNPAQLQALKQHLHNHKYHLPLFDTDKWVQDFEEAMMMIFDRFLSSQPTKPINLKQI